MFHLIAMILGALTILAVVSNRRTAIVLVGFWVYVFAALRFNAGFDYLSYVEEITAGDGRLVRYEPVSRVIMELSAATHPQWFFVITSAVVVGAITLAILNIEKRAPISRFGILAFIALPIGFLESLNYVRQMCAIALLIYALSSREKPSHFWAAVALAAGFHFSSILWIPVLIFVCNFRWTAPKLFYIVALGFAALSGPLIQYISEITGLYSHYFSQYQIPTGGRTLFLVFSILALCLLDLRRIRQHQLVPEFHYFFMGVTIVIGLTPYGVHLARFGWYGAAMYPIFVGFLLSRTDLGIKALSAGAMVIVFSGLLYLSSQHERWDGLNKYQLSVLVSPREADKIRDAYDKATSN